ncbi:hypothetical protein QM361_06365 [Streptococcus intermedius]|uniref:hypothetical protein n=1 Tax=Streptococcus intermedius TaxID=1338 RepID=UPI000C82A602|nr:hypothetical protein [Streptococcus intermedius]PMR66344.1 hypothetical protein C1I62_04265 [Streptococcus intermedius]
MACCFSFIGRNGIIVDSREKYISEFERMMKKRITNNNDSDIIYQLGKKGIEFLILNEEVSHE